MGQKWVIVMATVQTRHCLSLYTSVIHFYSGTGTNIRCLLKIFITNSKRLLSQEPDGEDRGRTSSHSHWQSFICNKTQLLNWYSNCSVDILFLRIFRVICGVFKRTQIFLSTSFHVKIWAVLFEMSSVWFFHCKSRLQTQYWNIIAFFYWHLSSSDRVYTASGCKAAGPFACNALERVTQSWPRLSGSKW